MTMMVSDEERDRTMDIGDFIVLVKSTDQLYLACYTSFNNDKLRKTNLFKAKT